MNGQQEFTALQVMVLVRTEQGARVSVQELLDSVPFQYKLQDALADLVKLQLKEAEVDFNEVIINLDTPAEKATKVNKKSSFMSRFFGSD